MLTSWLTIAGSGSSLATPWGAANSEWRGFCRAAGLPAGEGHLRTLELPQEENDALRLQLSEATYLGSTHIPRWQHKATDANLFGSRQAQRRIEFLEEERLLGLGTWLTCRGSAFFTRGSTMWST